MSAQRLAWLNRGLVFGSAFAALILLAMFYSVVNGAVERAAHRDAGLSAPAGSQFSARAAERARDGSPAGSNLLLAGSAR